VNLSLNKLSANVEVELTSDSLKRHEQFSVFQSPDFFDLLKFQNNATPFLFTVCDNKEIAGSLLAIRFSHKKGYPWFLANRTVIWGGPLF
jgi:hypothetical protein